MLATLTQRLFPRADPVGKHWRKGEQARNRQRKRTKWLPSARKIYRQLLAASCLIQGVAVLVRAGLAAVLLPDVGAHGETLGHLLVLQKHRCQFCRISPRTDACSPAAAANPPNAPPLNTEPQLQSLWEQDGA